MQNIVDEKRIARGAQMGKIATFVGLGFLVVGLVVSLVFKESPLLLLSFVCLLLGLLGSSIGSVNMGRWVREPRADQALVQGLKGFDDRYLLYNYVLPAPHVLLGPTGLWVFTMLGQGGTVRYEDGKLRRDFSLRRVFLFLSEEGMGRPLREADAQVQALQQFLDDNGVDGDLEIDNALVFFDPRVDLVVTDPPRPIVVPKGLKRAIRKQTEKKLSSAQYQQLKELFEGAVAQN
jgi:hypothetical protein